MAHRLIRFDAAAALSPNWYGRALFSQLERFGFGRNDREQLRSPIWLTT